MRLVIAAENRAAKGPRDFFAKCAEKTHWLCGNWHTRNIRQPAARTARRRSITRRNISGRMKLLKINEGGSSYADSTTTLLRRGRPGDDKHRTDPSGRCESRSCRPSSHKTPRRDSEGPTRVVKAKEQVRDTYRHILTFQPHRSRQLFTGPQYSRIGRIEPAGRRRNRRSDPQDKRP